jgi:type VI secretion system protein ImpG
VRDPTPGSKVKPVQLPASALKPVGFGEDEGMLPYPRRSFIGYRLLQEYFTFPEKFFFLDLTELEPVWAGGFKDRAEIVFLIGQYDQNQRKQMLELGITEKTFKLGCAPIVNLFAQTAEPVLLDQRKYEYSIVPDVRRPNATEVFSVDEVVSIDPQSRETMVFEPFYSYRHATIRDKKQTFWLAHRRPSGRRNDDGTEMTISLVDLSSRPVMPATDSLTIRTTCTNRDLPSRLPFGNDSGDFDLETTSAIKRIVALKKPTSTLRPPTGRSVLWRLLSHLSLNYLSLVEEGKEALQEILKLYNFTDSAYSEKQIEGILSIRSSRAFARVVSEYGITFARGTKVEMELYEEQFVGVGIYLFASIIERFFGLYVSLNSFSQLALRSKQRKEVIREWPPRAGHRLLL